MKTFIRDAAVAVLAMSMALAACGQGGGTGGRAGSGPRIGLLLPDAITSRWESKDRPLLEEKIKRLCRDCTVEHANANGDVAAQQRQVDSMITKGIDALLLVAVDASALSAAVRKAHDAGVPVISYDRLGEGPISGYVSFDGQEVGRLQARALLEAMARRGAGDQIVMINGDPTDPNTLLFEAGALSVLRGKVKIGKMYDTPMWRSDIANMNMSGAIADLGARNIDGVYSANDALASGIISALRANKVSPLPPVTGQDADLGAVRRIVGGEQYMTVWKPTGAEASAGAAMAVAAARGENLHRIATGTVRTRGGKVVPAVLLTPVSVTVGTIKDTLVKGGVYTVQQICVPRLRTACHRAGLTG
ncbi:sugar ABC transporter substrate-binding protein [Streptomyces sp. NBC_00557]|uniref:sugar ABC transporter substrate-binding protein n=1 Tax=Streptomyces sp. NBC_00557 TaxID=2975776 RepID=UPI002E7FC8C9|nr:substrate-binding domain-containing protein [Streptomyces sp. NBC_00557]WUC39354.1 substrate-binding domain-containing protein [Streptomyces sp. NBC_00557]